MPTKRLHDQSGAVLRVVSFVQSRPWLRRSVRYVIPNEPVIDLAVPMAARALADHAARDLYSMCASPMSSTDLPSHRYRVGAARLEECNAQPSDRRSAFAVFLPKTVRPQAAPEPPVGNAPHFSRSGRRCRFPKAAGLLIGLQGLAAYSSMPWAQPRSHRSRTHGRSMTVPGKLNADCCAVIYL